MDRQVSIKWFLSKVRKLTGYMRGYNKKTGKLNRLEYKSNR